MHGSQKCCGELIELTIEYIWQTASLYCIRISGADPEILDFASQMATFGAFWALSFTVWIHVLHIKSCALDLKSADNSQIGGFELL